MPNLSLKSFSTLVAEQAAAVQARASKLIDFSIGSVMLALAQANAALGLWLQGENYKTLLMTRLATSFGTDVDSFIADFGLARISATPAGGLIQYARFSPTSAANIPIGAQVQSSDGTQVFAVTIDSTNPNYNQSLFGGAGGYVMASGVASIAVPAKAVNASALSNVAANIITVLKTAITGVDTVNNAGAFTGGSDAETDAQVKSRFVLFINSLSKATRAAIGYAITSFQLGLLYTITEWESYATGDFRPGYIYIVFDDGTGTPSDALRDNIYTACDAVRAQGIRMSVFKPIINNVQIQITLTINQYYDVNTVVGQVNNALSVYVNTLPLGQGLSYFKLSQIAIDASPGVNKINTLFLNSLTADVPPSSKNVIKVNILEVSGVLAS